MRIVRIANYWSEMDIALFSRRLVELLPQLIRGISRYERNALSRGAITIPQLWALEYLARQTVASGTAMHEVARSLGISRPAATGLIDRLIHQQFAVRQHDPKDRRVVRVTITARGRRLLDRIWDQKRLAVARVFAKLSLDDRAEYLRILEQVVQTLTPPPVLPPEAASKGRSVGSRTGGGVTPPQAGGFRT